MAECKKCVCESVCRFNDGHNLYCKEDYECPHFCQSIKCIDCVFFAKSDTVGYGVCTSMTNPNYVPLYHSCSYGTPKERGEEK